ncbi:MAG: hypothetical protein HYT27_02140 [Parcubacteria group bacterium]|nr:hypothetical protein [Parcubacteria group bacterium]
MNEQDTTLNTPRNLESYKGQFVVFFSEDTDPKVLFNTFVAEEAYQKAGEIKKEQGREPIVIRVQESASNNIARILRLRF